MNKKIRKSKLRLLAQIIFPILCLLWLAFIFRNSFQNAEQSTGQSSTVVDVVQDVAQVIAPNSGIANATGPAYDRLHGQIRQLAHFTEFAILGILLCWCYFAYTNKLRFLYLPLIAVFFLPLCDECIQHYTAGRAGMLSDIITDTCGGLTGMLIAGIAWGIVLLIFKSTEKKSGMYALKG